MSMSTYVEGFKPLDEKFKLMKKIYDTCEEAGIAHPQEVEDFFEGERPDNKGISIDLRKDDCCSEFQDDGESGFEIEVEKLPKDIKIIRFYNSW